MFQQLMNFGLQRTAKQAFGFWLAHALLLGVGGGVSGLIAALITGAQGEEAYMLGARMGLLFALGYNGFLSFSILKAKNLLKNTNNWIWGVLAVVFCLLSGFISMILIAYLTTKPNLNEGASQHALES